MPVDLFFHIEYQNHHSKINLDLWFYRRQKGCVCWTKQALNVNISFKGCEVISLVILLQCQMVQLSFITCQLWQCHLKLSSQAVTLLHPEKFVYNPQLRIYSKMWMNTYTKKNTDFLVDVSVFHFERIKVHTVLSETMGNRWAEWNIPAFLFNAARLALSRKAPER